MDQQELQQKIAEYYAKLPPEVQTVFASMTWMETLKTISAKYNLHEEQIAALGTETTLAFLGILHPEEYEASLVAELKMPKVSVDRLVAEVNESIFKNIRPQLEATYTANNIDAAQAQGEAILDPRFSTLPPEAQKALASINYQKKLYDIGTKNKVPISQMANLENVTVDFITGKLSPSQYENRLAIQTELPADTVKNIAQGVNEDIMKSVRAVMQKELPDTLPTVANDDDVPPPPYKATKNQSSATSIYGDSGIEIMDDDIKLPADTEETMTLTEDSILAHSGIDVAEDKPATKSEHLLPNTATQQEALEGIEHPAHVASSIIGAKLSGATISTSTTKDYTLPKITSATPAQAGIATSKLNDPYKEPIS